MPNYHDPVLYRDQRLLGVKPWAEFADEAAIADLPAFETCMRLPADSFPRIAQGSDIGRRNGVRGTPTVWVNGDVMARSDLSSLRRAVTRALEAK
jgi:protein-disulfide isomerase